MDEFLTEAERATILEELDFALWRPSLTYMEQADGTRLDVLSDLRVSETAAQRWYSHELQTILANIEDRLESIFELDTANFEWWQATRYPTGGTFFYHLDSGYWATHYAGERVLTFLLYLTTPLQGGGTHFRALGTNVDPKAGRLVVWNNLFSNGDCNHRMIHSSVPLAEGNKVTLVTWLRQKRFKLPSVIQRGCGTS